MAFLRYFWLKDQGQASYILYSDDESAYLWSRQDGLRRARDYSPAKGVTGNLVLVLNEAAVWYPLMERDDSPRDPALAEVVRGYASKRSLPTLSEFEEKLIGELRTLTEVSSPERDYALLAAGKVRYRARELEPYSKVFRDTIPIFPADRKEFTSKRFLTFYQMGQTFAYVSTKLSPLTARLGAEDLSQTTDKVRAIAMDYYELASTRFKNTTGETWQSEMFWHDIEDGIFSRTGNCAIQANSVHVVLELAGIENHYIWESDPSGGHAYIYLPEVDWDISNGWLEEAASFTREVVGRQTVVVTAISSGGHKQAHKACFFSSYTHPTPPPPAN